MKHILLILTIIAAALQASADTSRYETLQRRAARAYDGEEWSSAAAMYTLLLDMRPDSLHTYARAIVANMQIPDSVATIDLMERAMSHGLGLADMLTDIRTQTFAIGHGDEYARYLLLLQRAMPYMHRALDHELLEYYTFRDDGPKMVQYARIMLAGLPDSPVYLNIMARGYLLSGLADEAVSTWTRLLDLHPDDYTALLNLGNYYVISGDKALARQYLSRAQALRPTPYVESTLSEL